MGVSSRDLAVELATPVNFDDLSSKAKLSCILRLSWCSNSLSECGKAGVEWNMRCDKYGFARSEEAINLLI